VFALFLPTVSPVLFLLYLECLLLILAVACDNRNPPKNKKDPDPNVILTEEDQRFKLANYLIRESNEFAKSWILLRDHAQALVKYEIETRFPSLDSERFTFCMTNFMK